MALLQVFVPDNWGSADITPLRWRRMDGVNTRAGLSPLGELPRDGNVELIIPASRVLLTRVKLPPGNAQKLTDVVGYAVEDKLLGDPETIHAALGSRAADGTVSAAIIDRAWLIKIRDDFAAAGLRPLRMTSEIALVPATAGAWDALWHGNHGWLRTGPELGLLLDDAGGGAPLALRLALREARASGAAPERILVHAAEGNELPDLARWQQELDLPVEAAAPWSWQRADIPALRGINLLQGRFAPSRSRAELLSRYRLPIRLAAVIGGLYIIVSIADWAWLAWQKHALQAQMTQTFKTAFPDAKAIVDAPLQMRRNLADLKRARGEAQPGDLLPQLANAVPIARAAGGTAHGVQYERGKLQLDLRLPQVQAAEALNQRLSAAGVRARVESVNPTPGGALARVTLTGGDS